MSYQNRISLVDQNTDTHYFKSLESSCTCFPMKK
uniref:Uncharacterized protein n=1 Tax=Lepeophtheirus salmonis TaxID=72036 RepID=A0A0K2T6I9_LEPSM